MAHYTRVQARATAKIAKQKQDFTILVAYRKDTGAILVKTYQKTVKELESLIYALKEEFPERVIVISGDELKPRLQGITSVKGLEDVLYQTVNAHIEDMFKTWYGNPKNDYNSLKEGTFYVLNVGYNGKDIRFYSKVRDTEEGVWLQRIGESKVKGTETKEFIVPNPLDIYPSQPIRVYTIPQSKEVKIGSLGLASEWNRKPVEREISTL